MLLKAVKLYKAIVPDRVRQCVRQLPGLKRLHRRMGENVELHDEIYNEAFYAEVGALETPERIWPLLDRMIDEFSPNSIIDAGCGNGTYMRRAQERGIEVHGVELSTVGLNICREHGLDVQPHDLTDESLLPWSADLVYSIEVAEHLAERFAKNYVRKLTTAARHHVVLTAALPGQDGTNHVNCQPNQYWIDLIQPHGFTFDHETTERWRQLNRDQDLLPWLSRGLMIYHRNA